MQQLPLNFRALWSVSEPPPHLGFTRLAEWRVHFEQVQFRWYLVVLRIRVFKFCERRHCVHHKLKQKLLHEFGLQLKHVVIKSAVRISMPVDFKKKRPLNSRKSPLCVI